jgi:hypothetical protein
MVKLMGCLSVNIFWLVTFRSESQKFCFSMAGHNSFWPFRCCHWQSNTRKTKNKLFGKLLRLSEYESALVKQLHILKGSC